MKEQWIRSGFSTYYAVKKEKDLTYEKEILLYHSLSCLLPCEFRMENEDVFYYYETGIYTLWQNQMETLDGREFFYYMIAAFEQMESYLLDLDHIKLTLDLVFCGKDGKPILCYLPEYEKNIFEQLRDFLESCIERLSHEQRKRVTFYYEFYNYLVKEKPNMEQLKEYLMPKLEEDLEIDQEEYLEDISDEWEQKEIIPVNNSMKKVYVFIGIAGVVMIVAGVAMVFFLRKIFLYGWYYPVLAGFLGSFILLIGTGVGCFQLRRGTKNLRERAPGVLEEPDFNRTDSKTELLDDKTVLLDEDILGTLIPENDNLEEIEILENGFIIGSAKEGTDYQFDEIGVSRRHVKFYLDENDVICEDMNSTNGTRINGRKTARANMKDGDIIQIGLEKFKFIRP